MAPVAYALNAGATSRGDGLGGSGGNPHRALATKIAVAIRFTLGRNIPLG